LGRKISYILDGGPASIGVESTIVDVRDPKSPVLLRPGAITIQQLERALACRVTRRKQATPQSKDETDAQLAPGMLARHYSPRTRVVLHERIALDAREPADEAFVFMSKPARRLAANVFWFDPRGNLRGIARRLFATLRDVDALKFNSIHVELAPGGGLADAINDRLRRAAAR
jgi:L-threonylcarbamoyladenylate synthase